MATAIDNLGRKIDSTNMTLKDIRSLIGTLMKSKVGAARPAFGNKGEKADKTDQSPISKVRELLQAYTKDFMKETEEQKGLLNQVVDALKDMTVRREEKKKEPKEKKEKKNKEQTTMARATDGLFKTFSKKGSGYTHDIYVEKALKDLGVAINHAINSKMGAMTTAASGGAAGGGGVATAAGGAGGGGKPPKQTKRMLGGFPFLLDNEEEKRDMTYLAIMYHSLHKIQELALKTQKAFLGWDSWGEIVGGMVEKEREFTQEARKTAFEIGGVTKESRGLQHAYESIGKTVAETGMNRTEFQESYKKAIRSGIKDLKAAVMITKAQLNVENQIGLKAGELQDTFQSWNVSGRMTTGQIAEMGRGLRDVAKFTGMTGESLKSAIESNKEFINQLRNSATLTAAAAKNIIEIGANAKRLGIEGEMQPLMKAMTSSSHLLLEASSGVQAFLFSAASSVNRMDDLTNGIITRSKSGIKDMAKGINNILKQFGVESVEAIDQLSDAAKRDLNLSLQSTYQLELGQVRSIFETLNEAGKGYSDRLNDINKKMKENITAEEKTALMEQARAMKTSASLGILNALDEAAKGAKNMNQALTKFGTRRKEFEEDMQAMGQTWTNESDVARGAIKNALDSVNEGLKKANKSEIRIDTSEIDKALKDPTAMRELSAKINKGQQELSTAQKSQLDPMSEMSQHLREINDNIRKFTQSTFSMVFDSWFGKLIVIVGTLAGIAAGIAGLLINSYLISHSLEDLGKLLRFKRPGQAAAHAAAHAPHEDMNALAKHSNVPHTTPTPPTAKVKAIGRVEGAVESFFEFMKKSWNRASNSLRSMGTTVEATTDRWASRIAANTELLAKEVEQSPIKSFLKLWKNSWIQTWEASKSLAQNINSVIRNGFTNAAELTNSGMNKISRQLQKIPELLMEIPKAAKNGYNSIKLAIKAAPQTGRLLAGGITKGIGTGLSAITKAGGQATGSLLKVAAGMNPLGLAIAATFVAIDGLTGGLEAASRAGKIFSKAQKDVTLNEEYAAKTAGLLVGVLNGFTLGIAGWILPLDKLTDSLARFNAKIPILTIVLGPLMVALEVLWGTIKGVSLAIWDIVTGIWGGIMNVVNPVVEGLSDIFSTIGNMFKGFTGKASGLTQTFRELGGVIGIVSGAIRFIGTAIGWIFRAIGSAIGFILKATLKLVEGFMVVLEPVVDVLSSLWDGAMEVAGGIGDVFMGLWDVISTIAKSIFDLFSPVLSIFGGGEGKGFMETMKSIGKALGYAVGFLLKLVLQPLKIVAKVLGGIGKMIQAIVKVFKGDFSGAGDLVKSVMGGVVESLLWPFKEVSQFFIDFGKATFNIMSTIFTKVVGVFGWIAGVVKSIANVIWSIVGGIFTKITSVFGWIAGVIGSVLGFIGNTIVAFAQGFMTLLSPIGEVFSALWGGVSEIGTGIYDVFGGIFDVFAGVSKAIYETFYGTYIILSEAFGDIGKEIYGFFKPIFNMFSGIESQGFLINVKAISTVLGQIIGGILKFVLWPLMLVAKVLGGIGQLIQAVVKVFKGDFSGAGKLVGKAVMGIVDAIIWPFKGIANYFYEFGSQILGYIASPFVAIYQIVESMVKGVMGWFHHLYMWLVGNSLVPDLVNGIITWFSKLPGMIHELVGRVIESIGEMTMQVPKMIQSMSLKLANFILTPFKSILNFFDDGFGDSIVNRIISVFEIVSHFIMAPLKVFAKVLIGIGKTIRAIVKMFKGDFAGSQELVKSAILGIVDEIVQPFKQAIQFFANFNKKLWDAITAPFRAISDFISGLFSGIIGGLSSIDLSETVNKMIDFGSWLYDNTISRMMGFGSWLFGNTIDAMKGFGSWLFNNTIGAMTGFGSWLFGNTIDAMKGFGSWLFKNTIGAMTDFGPSLFKNTIGGMAGFGSWLNDNTISKMSGFGDWLYDTFTSTMSKVMEYVLGLIPGSSAITAGAKAFTASEADNQKRVATEGSSIMSGIGRSIGGVKELSVNKALGGVKETGSAVLNIVPGGAAIKSELKSGIGAFSASEADNQKRVQNAGSSFMGGIGRSIGGVKDLSIRKALGGVGETGNAVLNKINPFNWFEEGTRKVEQTGVGVLHKNEMVVPSKDVKALSAKGEGKFEGKSFLSSLGSSISNTISPSGISGTPSDKAIDFQLSKQQAISQNDISRSLTELKIEATTGEGLLVRDLMSAKNPLNEMKALDPIISKFAPKSIEPHRAERAAVHEYHRQAKLAERNMLTKNDVSTPEISRTISPVAPMSPLVQDMNTAVAKDRAANSPDKTEVTSPELGKIADEAMDHNTKLDLLIDLFKEVVDALKPQSQPIVSRGGALGSTAPNEVVHQPANYMRSTVAPIAKSAGKAVLNVGVPNT